MENISNIESVSKIEQIKKNIPERIGGMALFNGLLLRNKKREVIVEVVNLKYKIDIINLNQKKDFIYKIPILRGILGVKNTILSSVPYIMSSAQNAINNIFEKDKNIKIGNFELYFGYIVAIFLIITLFTLVPNLLSLFFTTNIRNIVQVIFQSISFFMYMYILKNSSLLKDVFEFHGAEHKVVNAYENLKLNDITVNKVKESSRFHKRCGGNLIMYFFLLLVAITLIIPSSNVILKTIIQIMLLPLLVGIAYEILMLFSKLPKALNFILLPAMSIQLFTTKEPSEDKIRLAIYALYGCVKDDNNISVKDYIAKYKKNNTALSNFNLNDTLRIIAFNKKISKDKLFANMENIILDFKEQIVIDTLLHKLYFEHTPIQYILGKQFFYNEEYIVNENVLIPRPDTEILVEKAINYIKSENLEYMIDMCTGSGCVGISILKNSNLKFGILADISKDAIDVANKNVILNNVKNVTTICSDLFSNIPDTLNGKIDIIVSNPPYIKTSVIDTLSEEVKKEPKIALDGGASGLDIYIKIIKESKKFIKDNGYLIFEIGYDELQSMKDIIKKDKNFEMLESVKDLAGNDRVVVCRFHQI